MFLIHEGYAKRVPDEIAQKAWTMDDDGMVSLPEGPGLGVEVNEQAAIEFGQTTESKFQWPNARLRDGTISDY